MSTLTLTINEAQELAQLEQVIERGLQTFVEVGQALRRIDDGELWRGEYNSFSEYCSRRWEFSYVRAFQMMQASKVLDNLQETLTTVNTLPESERQTRPLAPLAPDEQRAAWVRAVESAPRGEDGTPKITAAIVAQAVEEVKGVAHVSYNSGNNEWYTPPEYIEAARRVMGEIDLDPASSDKANETVKAASFYTAKDDGLLYDWFGRVWLNPPYAGNLIGAFCSKLVYELEEGNITDAIVLVNNATETAWFGDLIRAARAVCFPRGRIRFIDALGNPSGAPLQGQAVLYMGKDTAKFYEEFCSFGWVSYVA